MESNTANSSLPLGVSRLQHLLLPSGFYIDMEVENNDSEMDISDQNEHTVSPREQQANVEPPVEATIDWHARNIELIMSYAGVNRATALESLQEGAGDVVDAILYVTRSMESRE
jgi:NACalpha-BTF3-like transcription factor